MTESARSASSGLVFVDSAESLSRAEAFVAQECSLADSHDYAAWLNLWSVGECAYWVPARGNDTSKMVSVIFDNRARLQTRVRQLMTEQHYSQIPTSTLARVVTGMAVVADDDPDILAVHGTFVLVEYRDEQQVVWAGRVLYRLIEEFGELRMRAKTVELVNRSGWLPTLSFLI